MILLTTTTDLLEIITTGTQSTDWTCSYVDVNYSTSTFVPGSAQGNVATATTTTVAGSPAVSTQRQIKYLSVTNRDSVNTQNVTVAKSSASVGYNLTGSWALLPGYTLQYVDSHGFEVINAAGAIVYVGTTGAPGTTGAQGPSGPAVFLVGEPGDDGQDGRPGATGPIGSAGPAGPAGPAVFMDADPGQDGDMGPPGPPGTPGTAGSTGAQGPMGPAVYLDGEAGADGDMGPPGPAGPAGPAGAIGTTGSAGPMGPAVFMDGDAGADGEPGPPGPPGNQGPQGTTGSTGSTGAAGPMGPAVFMDADSGDQGDIGPPGPQGIQGPQGIPGTGGTGGGGYEALWLEYSVDDPWFPGIPTDSGPLNIGGALTVAGVINTFAATINGSAASGQSKGLLVNAGTTSADTCVAFWNQPSTTLYGRILGDGSGAIGWNGAANTLVWNATGAVTINQPSLSGSIALTITGSNGTAYAVEVTNSGSTNALAYFNAGSSSGNSRGLLVQAGTTNADYAMQINNGAGTSTYFEIFGDGGVSVGGYADPGAGNFSADVYVVNGNITGSATSFAYTISANPSSALTTAGFIQLFGSTNATPSIVNIGTNGAIRLAVAANGTVSINAPASGQAFTASGLAGSYTAQFTGSSTSGSSYGVLVAAGTTSADVCFALANQANNVAFLNVYGDGHGNLGATGAAGLQWTSTGAMTANIGMTITTAALIGAAAADTVGFYGKTPAAQTASNTSMQTSNVASASVSVSTAYASAEISSIMTAVTRNAAILQEVMNVLFAIGIYATH